MSSLRHLSPQKQIASIWYVFVAAIVCLGFTNALSFGEEVTQERKTDERNAWSEYYASQLPRYKFSLASSPGEQLDLPYAKLRWSNPLRPGTHGDLFVWSHHGRGVMVGSVFSYHSGDGRRVAHQFQSLTTETIRCEYEGGDNFVIQGPGLKFEPIPAAAVPAEQRVSRLIQMRGLARGFQASCLDKGVFQPLRALTQPIYRFEGERVEEDGAIFGFVMGTDPELLLVISALQTTDGPRWHYAAARFASEPLRLTHQGETIWAFDDDATQLGYVSKHGIDFQPKIPILEKSVE